METAGNTVGEIVPADPAIFFTPKMSAAAHGRSVKKRKADM